VLGGQLATDANLSLRVSYGTVRSFKPGSTAAADRPLTTANQDMDNLVRFVGLIVAARAAGADATTGATICFARLA
jgi:hypothetical protein